MNTNLGLIGKKLGNTQVFDKDGNVRRVTVIECGPCTVLGKRTQDAHGYNAVVLGFGSRPERLVSKPELGTYKKLGKAPARTVQELRLPAEAVAKYEVGQVLSAADIFNAGQMVDVTGQTKGRGFTGVMKRWNFKGSGTATHGTHEYQRHGGAIGTNMTPGRTLPNLKMPGQYGNERVTIQNQPVVEVIADKNVVLVEGAIPGHRNSTVIIRHAVKAKPAAA